MNILLVLLLVLTTISIMVVITLLLKVIQSGKHLPLNRHLVGEHKKWVHYFLWSLLPTFFLSESIIREQHQKWGNTTLFTIHVVFVLLFVFSIFGMRILWTGIKNPNAHRRLSKYFLFFFLVVAGTGSALVLQLFMK